MKTLAADLGLGREENPSLLSLGSASLLGLKSRSRKDLEASEKYCRLVTPPSPQQYHKEATRTSGGS